MNLRFPFTLPLLSLLLLLLPTACIDDPEVEPGIRNARAPLMSEALTINALTASSVTLTSGVQHANGANVTERGFCWSERQAPTVDDNARAFGNGIGEYQGTIDGLVNGRDYYFRPYARNAKGISYGEERKVQTTSGLGIVHTFLFADSTHAETALCGGRIEAPGEGEILARGIYYSTSPDMSRKDSVLSTAKTDSFICRLTDLRPSTTYYVEAFVRNRFGAFTGADTRRTFTTPDGRPVLAPMTIDGVGYTFVRLSAGVISAGDAPVRERGFCWSTIPNPSILNSPYVDLGAGTGSFNAECTGLEPNRKYYVRAYAGNHTYGYTYSPQDSFTTLNSTPNVATVDPTNLSKGSVTVGGRLIASGQSTVTACGVCWSLTKEEPTLGNANVTTFTLDPTNNFSGTLNGLKGGETYYIRAYATNADGTSYGKTIALKTPAIFTRESKDFPGSPRVQSTPTWFSAGDRAYLLGGDIGPYFTSDLYFYNTSTDEWRQMLACPAGPLKWQTAVTLGGSAYVFGGINVNQKTNNSFYRYDIASNTWYVLSSTPAPDSLCLSLGVTLNGNIFLVGGRNDTATNHVWSYNIAASTWIRQPNFPAKHYGGTAVQIGTFIYAGLGRNADGSFNRNLWRTVDMSVWTTETVCSLADGGILAGVACRNRLYVIDESYNLLEYDPSNHTWTRRSKLPANLRGIHCMYVVNDLIYIGLSQNPSKLIVYDPTWDN